LPLLTLIPALFCSPSNNYIGESLGIAMAEVLKVNTSLQSLK